MYSYSLDLRFVNFKIYFWGPRIVYSMCLNVHNLKKHTWKGVKYWLQVPNDKSPKKMMCKQMINV